MQTLIVLVRHAGKEVSKDELMKLVWPDAFVEEANLSQNIFVLRKALGEGPKENRYIATIPGRGYTFVAHVEDLDEHSPDRATDRAMQPVNASGLLPTVCPKSHKMSRRGLLIATAVLGATVGSVIVGILPVPWLATYYNNGGVERQQKGDLKGAINDYLLALWFNRNYAEARYNLGDAYEEIPDYNKAAEQYQRAIDADPTFYPAYNNLARLYIIRQKDYMAAMRLVEHALSFEPKEPSILYTLYRNYGWANLEAGYLGQAEQNLRNALKLDVQRGSAHCLLGQLWWRQGRQNDARQEWETCLRYSNTEVETEWRIAAKEFVETEEHLTGTQR
jgi:DNA-binding winged helix-turn-helix (wHTH) protein